MRQLLQTHNWTKGTRVEVGEGNGSRIATRARFAGGVAGVRPRLEKPRPRLEDISENAAGVGF